jgi:hypothetical protein
MLGALSAIEGLIAQPNPSVAGPEAGQMRVTRLD